MNRRRFFGTSVSGITALLLTGFSLRKSKKLTLEPCNVMKNCKGINIGKGNSTCYGNEIITVYVCPRDGCDKTGDGSLLKPYRSIQRAIDSE